MTLEDIKEEIAISWGYENWNMAPSTEEIFDAIAEAYAKLRVEEAVSEGDLKAKEPAKGICVSCELEKETHEMCMPCAIKLGLENPEVEAKEERPKLNPYGGDLNIERIKAYRSLHDKYIISEVTVGEIFCAGMDWMKQKYDENITSEVSTHKEWIPVTERLPLRGDRIEALDRFTLKTWQVIIIYDRDIPTEGLSIATDWRYIT